VTGLHIFHDWSRWEPIEREVPLFRNGRPIFHEGTHVTARRHLQKRDCLLCGLIQERERRIA